MKICLTYLESYRFIKKEMADLLERIKAIGDVKAIRPKLNPQKADTHRDLSDDIVKIDQLRKKYNRKWAKSYEVLLNVELYLDTVKDPEIRTAIRLKYIDGMSWEEVGRYLRVDRSGIAKKVKDYVLSGK